MSLIEISDIFNPEVKCRFLSSDFTVHWCYVILQNLNSWLTDELVNWCHWRLVGASQRYQAQQGGSMTILRAENHPCKPPPTSITETTVDKFTWPNTYHEPLPMRGGKGWALNWQNRQQSSDLQSSTEHANCKYDDQSSDPSNVVIHED